MSLLHLKECEHRIFDKVTDEIFCKRDSCLKKSVEDCIKCMAEMT